jgi:hypothetical protein
MAEIKERLQLALFLAVPVARQLHQPQSVSLSLIPELPVALPLQLPRKTTTAQELVGVAFRELADLLYLLMYSPARRTFIRDLEEEVSSALVVMSTGLLILAVALLFRLALVAEGSLELAVTLL